MPSEWTDELLAAYLEWVEGAPIRDTTPITS